MRRWYCSVPAGLLALATASVAQAQPVGGQWEVSAYFGTNFALDNDLHIVRPGGTDVTYSGISWDAKPFKTPPIFGFRGTYWLASMPNIGFGIDYTHAKVYSRLGNVVGASGTVNGAAFLPQAQVLLGSQFTHLEFTDGLNILTAHMFYRYQMGMFVPYGGVGIGPSIPHTEISQTNFPVVFKYQVGGIAARGYAGVEIPVGYGWAAFGEYQLSFEQIRNQPLDGGGHFNTNFINHHLNAGISYSFKPPF